MNYQESKELLAKGRDNSYVIHSNLRTTLEPRDGNAIALKLVNTDVVTYYLDGRIVLDSGGWRTVTTKRRMNDYQDRAVVFQDKGQWYVAPAIAGSHSYNWQNSVPFADGLTLHPDGSISNAASKEEAQAYCTEKEVPYA